MMIKIIIVEDDAYIRENLEEFINSKQHFTCVASADNLKDAKAQILKYHPDVVLMDLKLGEEYGVDCIKEIKSVAPDIQFIVTTVFEDSKHVFESLKAGAVGYLVKGGELEQITDAVLQVYHGGSSLSANIARNIVNTFKQTAENQIQAHSALTTRENEILTCLSEGLLYKELADKLGISIDTVRSHIRHIYEKLQVNSRAEAVNKVFLNKSKQ
jgi:DNA-binding NarL/FixJ family response regulator